MTESPAAAERDLADKMQVIGRLAGGIAHDFNNLLTGILLYCDLLAAGLEGPPPLGHDLQNDDWQNDDGQNDDWQNDDWQKNDGQNDDSQSNLETRPDADSRRWRPVELRQHVEEIRTASELGAALTQQLLAISRKHVPEPRPVNLNQVVASTENLLRRLIGEQVELIVLLDPARASEKHSGERLVLADAAQLRQILLNLVLNARDALPGGGKIWLITQATECASLKPRNHPGKGLARPAVSLTVQDNGSGMTAATRARLFEPFFTTKKEGEGAGLGLATVRRIVDEAGGVIEVESEPDRGTRIEVFFPLIEPFP